MPEPVSEPVEGFGFLARHTSEGSDGRNQPLAESRSISRRMTDSTTPNAPTAGDTALSAGERYRMHDAFLATAMKWHQRGNTTWYLEPEYINAMFDAVFTAALLAARREVERMQSAIAHSCEETNAWKCDQCGYLVKHLRHEPPDRPCPNDRTPLRALSWRDLAEAEAALNRRLINALPDNEDEA